RDGGGGHQIPAVAVVLEDGQLAAGAADVHAEVAGHRPWRRRGGAVMAAVAVAPQRSMPAFRPSTSRSRVRMPPAALTLTRGETVARISRRLSKGAPEGG